jgi:predicted HicB family RNase H-like nuclease
MEKQRGPGRPPRDPSGEASKIVPIRMTDSERIEYQKAAERSGLSLSEWARAQLNRAAKRQAKEA